MSRIQKCQHGQCGGSLISGSCISCGRSPEPERISLAEALLGNSVPEHEPNSGERQRAPLAVSLERAAAWGRGEQA